VPNAIVTATNTETNIQSTAKSNEAGNYTIAQLKEGNYTVRGQAPGFTRYVVDNVRLVARDTRRVDIRLEVGSVESAVEITAGASLIETETARITNTKDTLVLNTLPTNSRGLWAYLNLSPGLQGQDGSSVTRFAGSRVNREQLVHRWHNLFGWRRQHANGAARQLHRVVPGSEDRPGEQFS
jgi:hypothetical protein